MGITSNWQPPYINQILMEREKVLLNFAMSGAFINELMQMEQPSTGKWWVQ